MNEQITIRGARLHNLKNVSLSIPKNRLVVFTGVSGSGKSTLAFDTLNREGQRQYLESLGLVTGQVSKPSVDSIEGLSPSISVDQHLGNHSPRSTVGTATEVYTYLRVLFARIGHRPCPACGADVPPLHDVGGEETVTLDEDDEEIISLPCPQCGAPIQELSMGHFSFNKPEGACPSCTGLGFVQRPRLERLVNDAKSILGGAVYGWDEVTLERNRGSLLAAADHYGFEIDLSAPFGALGGVQKDLVYWGVESAQFSRHFPGVRPPDARRRGLFEGVATNIMRRYAEHLGASEYAEKLGELLRIETCPACNGARLKPETLAVTVNGLNILSVARLPLTELAGWLEDLPSVATPEEIAIIEPILVDLRERIHRLVEVGVGYLHLDRATPTLSAGEAHRLRLAALLGSGLTGVLYVLDEPTTGLHPQDTQRLLKVLGRLRDLGNTVLLIEHDMEVLKSADFVVDIGPGGGRNGGRIVAAGTPAEIAACAGSITGQYLCGAVQPPASRGRIQPQGNQLPATQPRLSVFGARQHNLKNIDVAFPLRALSVVCGASGGGKSSLMLDILARAARKRFHNADDEPGAHDAITGWEHIDKVITIDQLSIGRMPRSNAATYTDVFTPIREVFARLPGARQRNMSARHFSFNVPGGRCERCEGAGVLDVKMHFLPDVQVRCPVCHGRRFKKEVLEVKYSGPAGNGGGMRQASIHDVLEMTIEEALVLFEKEAAVRDRLSLMCDVGLGYLKLGQPASTLSGGEAQRVKMARDLTRPSTDSTLYLLDEPSSGLHSADVARMLVVLQRLVDAGNSVVVVEHNLDVIRAADWVIELGPEGGSGGGYLVAQGTPEQVAASGSPTGEFLR